MTHDPLCHLSRETGEFSLMAGICYHCKLIAKVRADTLDKAEEAVRAVLGANHRNVYAELMALSAIDALRDES